MLRCMENTCNPALGRHRQEDRWDSVTRQSSPLGELQANDRLEVDSVPKDNT